MLRRFLFASIVVLPCASFAQSNDAASVAKAVEYCVNIVHKTKLSAEEAYLSSFYKDFDAFVNPASGLIENSARRNGDQKPLFIFNKCMASRGFPLTQPNQGAPNPLPGANCTEEELKSRNGDCWIKMSATGKLMLEYAFSQGFDAAQDFATWDLYAASGKSAVEWSSQHSIRDYFDHLYAEPANRSIDWALALDLAQRSAISGENGDLPHLVRMYREHHIPPLNAYLKSFISPNKVVVSRFDDSAWSEDYLSKNGWKNTDYVVTLVGVSEDPSTEPLNKLMAALLNIKQCKSLRPDTEAYKFYTYLKTDKEREEERDREQNFFSTRLKVVINYDPHPYQQRFFNQRGELSAEILLDKAERICWDASQQSSFGAAKPVTLGDIMLSGAANSNNDFGGALRERGSEFISLNQYLIANGLRKGVEDQKDPRHLSGQVSFFAFLASALPTGVTKVLQIGEAN
ncbi:MAG TPA: hypothetical protein VGU20_01095 [Stellaceae bacterium]|nr:hypothetical protein [Stellaceae bacterium]